MVEFLRIKKASWHFAKWFHVVFPVVAAIGLWLLFRRIWESDFWVFVALVAPIYYLAFGTWLLWALGQWRGQPHVDLLLRLVDEAMNRPDAPVPAKSEQDADLF